MARHRPKPLSRFYNDQDRDVHGPHCPLYPCAQCGQEAIGTMCTHCGHTFSITERARREIHAGMTQVPRYEYRRHKGRWVLRERVWHLRGRKGLRAADGSVRRSMWYPYD